MTATIPLPAAILTYPLKGGEFRLYGYLLSLVDDDGWTPEISQDALAQVLHLKHRNRVMECLRGLLLVRLVEWGRPGRGHEARYRVTTDPPAWDEPVDARKSVHQTENMDARNSGHQAGSEPLDARNSGHQVPAMALYARKPVHPTLGNAPPPVRRSSSSSPVSEVDLLRRLEDEVTPTPTPPLTPPTPPPNGTAAPRARPALPAVEPVAVEPPEALMEFHATLVGAPGYAPNAAFFEKVAARFLMLPLDEIALGMRDWITRYNHEHPRKVRECSTAFMLGWLRREHDRAVERGVLNGGTNGTTYGAGRADAGARGDARRPVPAPYAAAPLNGARPGGGGGLDARELDPFYR